MMPIMGKSANMKKPDALFDDKAWTATQLSRVEHALEKFIQDNASPQLAKAMRYAALSGGKRLRPLLVLASAQAVGALESEAAVRASCAVEFIHAYSLIHDDMPCMDNDVLRRGQPTVHVQFGEAIAMLAGDALQALAFEVLTPNPEGDVEMVPLHIQAKLANLLARAAGTAGMAGGQGIDLLNVGANLNEAQLQKMHQHKTGALLGACVAMGITCQAGATISDAATKELMNYAHSLGLAFQVVDDILDATAPSNVIGKTAGKDAHAGKPTYVTILGLEVTKQRAQDLYRKASQALKQSGLKPKSIAPLQALASKIVLRSY